MDHELNSSNDSEFSHDCVVIDTNACDLNLNVDKDCLLAYPISSEGFCSMWAGCRANYGVKSSKTAFEVHLEENCECIDLPKDDLEPYLLRVGWSLNYSPLQLGESEFSFGYCSTGKKCCNNVFEDYGEPFEVSDSIASYINFNEITGDVEFSFSKNGIDLGTAFVVCKKDLDEHLKNLNTEAANLENHQESLIFFPHVLTKNIVFEMNFGQRVSLIGDEPFAPIKSDFKLIQKLPIENRFSNEIYLKKENEVENSIEQELILVIGLPGAGKTRWAINHSKKYPKKFYYIIGVASILDKMKMLGLKKKLSNTSAECSSTNSIVGSSSSSRSSSKIQPELLDKILKCMNILMEIASQSNHNIILDQANVFTSTRRRKLDLFKNFRKKIVVLVQENEIYKERIKTSEIEDNGREIPVNLLNDMKTNFTLPIKTDEIESIDYVDLNEEEAAKVIEIYNKEGIADRLEAIKAKRIKKSAEIAKSYAAQGITIRPGFRPGYFNNSTAFNRDPRMFTRYPGMTNSFNVRRPINASFGGPNQFHFQNEIQMASFQRPSIGNYMGVMSANIQQTDPYFYAQTQPGYYPVNSAYQQQGNWLPVQMVSNPNNSSIILPITQHPTQQQYWRATQINQFQNRFSNSSLNMNNGNASTLVPNPWDPAMSTNVSSLITQSIHTRPSSNNSNN